MTINKTKWLRYVWWIRSKFIEPKVSSEVCFNHNLASDFNHISSNFIPVPKFFDPFVTEYFKQWS